MLKNFEDQERPPEDLPLVNWAMRDSLFLIQNRLINILRNFPIKRLGKLIKFVIFRLGHATYKKVVGIDNYEALPTQALRDEIITDGEARLVRTAQQLSQQVIAVDSFSRKDVEQKYQEDAV